MSDRFFKEESLSCERGYELGLRATIAMDIIRHCALVTGVVNGEDSAGRSKIDVMPSHDVATRAVEIADAMVGQFEQRGWVKEIALTVDEAMRLKSDREEVEWSRKFKNKDETKQIAG